MANSPPFDPYGNPVPATPGYRQFLSSLGAVVRPRNTIRLGSGLTATDDGVDSTTLNVQVDEASAELAHANTVCAFTKPSQVLKMEAGPLVNTLGSHWYATGSGSTYCTRVNTGTDAVGGAWKLGTGTSASQTSQLGTATATNFTIAFVNDLAAGCWHVRYFMKVFSTVDATTNMGVGLAKVDASAMLVGGVLGALSTTKFCLNNSPETNSATKSVLSTVSIDANWHQFDIWADGTAGKVYFAVDNETPVSITGLTWGAPAGPWAHACNGTTSADQAILLRNAYYRVNGAY